MAATLDCPRCGSAAVVLVWNDEKTGDETVGLWCEFCGNDVATPEWLILKLKPPEEVANGL